MTRHGRALLGCRQLVALTIVAFSLTPILVTPVTWAEELQVSASKPITAEQKVAERILNTLSLPTELAIVDLAATEVDGLHGQYTQSPDPTSVRRRSTMRALRSIRLSQLTSPALRSDLACA